MISWRGWGVSVLWLFVFWIFVGIALVVAFSPYEPDKHKAMMEVEEGFAGLFALHALSVWAVVQYRRRTLQQKAPPGPAATEPVLTGDEFMFVPLVYWPYILFAVVLLFAGAAYFGYPLFN